MILTSLTTPQLGHSAGRIWHTAAYWSVVFLVISMIAAFGSMQSLAGFYFIRQDMPVIILAVVLCIFVQSQPTVLFTSTSSAIKSPWIVSMGVIAIILGGWVGSTLVMHNYILSRDEQMAVQDAMIFSTGRFMVPLPGEWHNLTGALLRDFNSTTFRPEMTISGYRPVNAFAHALMQNIGLMRFTAPIFAALGLIATWRVAVRIWPAEPALHKVAVLFYLCSTQMWAASMTTYAMSLLLGLNMTWLALFLRNDLKGYIAAIPVGFLAIGAHQVPYHLMFAAPFIALALVNRRWRVAAIFGLLYVAFAIFWFRYEDFVSFMMGGGILKTESQTLGNTIGGYIPGVTQYAAIPHTAANVLRLLAWQHLLVLPLILVAIRTAVRDRNALLVAMIVTCILPIIVKFMQISYQGHGYGYRYLHGSIGLLCLIAAAGWRELLREGIAHKLHLNIATALTVTMVAPWLLWNAHQFVGAYATVDKQLNAINSDLVIIDTQAASFGGDLVVNRPDMDNRPIRLMAAGIGKQDIPVLCKMGTIAFLPNDYIAPVQKLFGTPIKSTEEYQQLKQQFQQTCPSVLRVIPSKRGS